MRKKILFVIRDMGGGGEQRVMMVLLRHLARTRFEPVVAVCGPKTDYYKKDMPRDVSTNFLNRKNLLDIPRIIFSLSRLIKREAPDIVCGFSLSSNLLMFLSRWLSRINIPLIFTEHSNLTQLLKQYPRFSFVKRLLIRKFYPMADHIICVSKGVRDNLAVDFSVPVSDDKCTVIYNPIEIECIKAQTKKAVSHLWFMEKRPVIVACGRLNPQKNYPLLLKAVAMASEEIPDIRLIILGDGELRDMLSSYANELGIAGKVDFVGFQKNPFTFMARADVFILSSLWEGFGVVLIEAMACGTAVVSTRCPSGPDETITHEVNGLLVPVGDERALADAILRLLKDESLRRTLAEAGRKLAEDFDVKKVVVGYERLFDCL